MIRWTPEATVAPSGKIPEAARYRPYALAVALAISMIATPCSGMEISRIAACDGGDVLRLRGDIRHGDYVKFRSQFDGQRRIAGLDLDSPGGLLNEGVQIAMLTRQKRLPTFVAGQCDSVCAFIFLLGRKRYVSSEAKIGVHAVGNDYGREDGGTIRDTISFARLSAKLGIPSSAIGKMVTTPPRKITFLDQADLSALKVIVRDPFARKADGNQTCSSGPAEEAAGAPTVRIKTSDRPESRSGSRTSFADPAGQRKARSP